LSAQSRTLSQSPAYIVNDTQKQAHQTAFRPQKRRSLGVVPNRRPLMPATDPALDDAVREIANLLATAHLRIRFPEPLKRLDSPETESDSCDCGLTT
jgi:hypothetical protein